MQKTHQTILRKKDYNIDFDLSFNNFWKNHKELKIQPTTILAISKDTFLPKETVRRKILKLVKNKILIRTSKIIGWFPGEEYKKDYNQFIEKEILQVVKITHFICKKFNYSISNKELEVEIKKRFSFYWFHYLDLELKWMKLWKLQVKDLEIVMIFMQIATLLSSRVDQGVSHNKLFSNPDIIKEPQKKQLNVSISATSLSDITNIPRATCIRKLNQMASRKMITQDKKTKRYYIIPEVFTKSLVSKELTVEVTNLFSKFYFIIIKALTSKISN